MKWKGHEIFMNKTKNKENELKFNTYCIFTNEEQDVNQTIGLIFKDYLENVKRKRSKNEKAYKN